MLQRTSQLLDSLACGNDAQADGEGAHQPPMLEFTFKDGRVAALSYAYLYRLDFDGADTLRLYFLHDVVTVCGRGLRPLVDRLQRQTERRICERDALQSGQDTEGIVNNIAIEAATP